MQTAETLGGAGTRAIDIRPPPNGPQDCPYDPVMGSASTQMAIQCRAHLRFGRYARRLEQSCGSRHDSAQTITALPSLLVEQRFLNRVRILGGTETLDRCDLLALERPDRHVAGRCRPAID